MGSITYQGIDKIYPNGFHAVKSLDLEIHDGEFMVIVGPSGCGKTTAMRMCAGLEDISGGKLLIDGQVVNHLQPQQRNISMVFQNYALYPHMTVRGNLEFPLQMRKQSKADIKTKVDQVARMLELGQLLDRKPKQLSGGQRQRVAMGRALVRDPAAFLMDEPLSNLDAKLRVTMRAEISKLQRDTGTTTIYVTHDQVEAMTMGDRVAVMRLGVLQQAAPPQELYDHPCNTFVAAFIGSPSMNLFKTRMVHEGGQHFICFGDQNIALSPEAMAEYPQLAEHTGEGLTFGLRPEAFVAAERVETNQTMLMTPQVVEPLGHEQMLHVPLEAEAVLIQDAVGEDDVPTKDLMAVMRLDNEQQWKEGVAGTIGIDTRHLHVFDADGNRLEKDA